MIRIPLTMRTREALEAAGAFEPPIDHQDRALADALHEDAGRLYLLTDDPRALAGAITDLANAADSWAEYWSHHPNQEPLLRRACRADCRTLCNLSGKLWKLAESPQTAPGAHP